MTVVRVVHVVDCELRQRHSSFRAVAAAVVAAADADVDWEHEFQPPLTVAAVAAK